MTSTDLLVSLESAGFSFRVKEGKLIVSPASKLTANRREAIVANRRELMFLTYEATADDLACLDWDSLIDAAQWREAVEAIREYNARLAQKAFLTEPKKKDKKRKPVKTMFGE